jgi:hypothetical protein
MKVELIVPNNLNEVTLGQYQEYMKVADLPEMEMAIRMVEIFCGLNREQVRSLKATDISDIANVIATMFENTPSLIHRFKMKGVEYGFIPSLDEMSFGEYIDLDTYIGDWDNMEKAMGVLYRPVTSKYGEKYVIEDYEAKDAAPMKDMPMDAVLGSILFFYRLGKDLSRIILTYSQNKKEANLQRFLNSEENGVGTVASMHSLNRMLGDLNISLN